MPAAVSTSPKGKGGHRLGTPVHGGPSPLRSQSGWGTLPGTSDSGRLRTSSRGRTASPDPAAHSPEEAIVAAEDDPDENLNLNLVMEGVRAALLERADHPQTQQVSPDAVAPNPCSAMAIYARPPRSGTFLRKCGACRAVAVDVRGGAARAAVSQGDSLHRGGTPWPQRYPSCESVSARPACCSGTRLCAHSDACEALSRRGARVKFLLPADPTNENGTLRAPPREERIIPIKDASGPTSRGEPQRKPARRAAPAAASPGDPAVPAALQGRPAPREAQAQRAVPRGQPAPARARRSTLDPPPPVPEPELVVSFADMEWGRMAAPRAPTPDPVRPWVCPTRR